MATSMLRLRPQPLSFRYKFQEWIAEATSSLGSALLKIDTTDVQVTLGKQELIELMPRVGEHFRLSAKAMKLQNTSTAELETITT